jgi:hypothetical protein
VTAHRFSGVPNQWSLLLLRRVTRLESIDAILT